MVKLTENKSESKSKHNLIDVISFCQEKRLGGIVVGRWVWVKFAEKPAAEVRQALKDFGFFWNRRRSAWMHNCGHKSRPSNGDPRLKYGTKEIIDDREAVQSAVK